MYRSRWKHRINFAHIYKRVHGSPAHATARSMHYRRRAGEQLLRSSSTPIANRSHSHYVFHRQRVNDDTHVNSIAYSVFCIVRTTFEWFCSPPRRVCIGALTFRSHTVRTRCTKNTHTSAHAISRCPQRAHLISRSVLFVVCLSEVLQCALVRFSSVCASSFPCSLSLSHATLCYMFTSA